MMFSGRINFKRLWWFTTGLSVIETIDVSWRQEKAVRGRLAIQAITQRCTVAVYLGKT